jgi:hypothetical protein
MPREWRFAARLTGWPPAWASADAPRLRADIAHAFVDRTPIDWAALLTRVRDAGDRASVEELRRLDRVRGVAGFVGPQAETVRRTFLFLRVLIAISVLQTAFGLSAAVVALVAGRSLTALVPHLLLTVAFAGASLLLGGGLPRDRRSLFLLATFAFAASAFARAVPLALTPLWPAPPDVLFRGVFPEAFAPATLWQFAVAFPHVRRFTSFDIFVRRAAAAAWALGLILFVLNLALEYHLLGGWAATVLGRDHPGNAFWHLFALAALPAVLTILVRSHRAPLAERRKVARFASAIVAGAAPFLLSGLVRMSLPRVNEWVLTADPAQRFWLDALVVGALTAMPVLTSLAIILDRPFEFQSVLPRRLRGWMAGLRGGVVETARSRSFWRTGHRERLSGALEHVRLARSSREIAVILGRELQLGVGAAYVRILDRTSLPSDTALIPMLGESTAPLELSNDSQLFPLMPRQDRDWLEANGIALVAPLKLRDGSIAAVVALGAKHGHSSFDTRDCWFISTLLTGAAAAWDSLGAAAPDGRRDETAFECSGCGTVAGTEPLPCGCPCSAILAALPLQLNEKFIVVRRIGSGGMGVVYLGRDRALDREVALKTLPELHDGAVSRLTDEARAMAALNHESLATIYGLELWRRTPVLVVEYFPDGTLAEKLARGPLSPAETIALGIRLAGALTYMHARGVLHRDIKPSNIGFTATGAPKLLDFGLATDDAAFAGTAEYLPPEALDGAPPNAAVDLWGLSTVLLQSCGGRDRVPGAPGAFFDRALAADPGSRFQSSDEMRTALQALEASLE